MAHPLQTALVHHQRGKLDQARPIYEAFLVDNPDHADALNLLGVLLLQQGHPQQAVDRLQRAALHKPTDAGLLNNLGNALRANKQPDQAAGAWRKALALDPTNADAWCNLGVYHLEGGRRDEAASAWRKALALNAQHVDALNMLAVMLNQDGDVAGAMARWRAALDVAPRHALIAENLVAALTQQADKHIQGGRYQRAEKLVEEITRRTPDDIKGWVLLGSVRQRLGKLRDAFAAYQRALVIDDARPEIHHNIGNVLKESGQNEQAIAAFRRALALGSTHPATQHALAALTGEATAASPHAVVRDLFDDYAQRFDAHLTGELAYQTPGHLRDLHGARPVARLLDLGCGTGLSGQAFADIAGHITGVDLSPKMLDVARAKNLYAELAEADLLSFLQRVSAPYDLIVAADVLVYFGALEPLLAAAAGRLAEDGAILFSVEKHTGEEDFILQPSERYAHSDAYVERAAAAAGLAVAARQPRRLRKDGERWIEGTLYKLQRA